MKIAVIGHIRHPIAEPFMGGMESHCHQLVKGLQAHGHDVTLFAAPGSDATQVHPICDAPYEAVLPWQHWHGTDRLNAFQDRAFTKAQKAIETGEFDIVHNNSLSPSMIEWSLAMRTPMVTSQHVPPFASMRRAVEAGDGSPSSHFTVTSHHQRRLWNLADASNMHVVSNGIALGEWQPAKRRGAHLLWYGRITPTKGLKEAVAAALKAGVHLKIVGLVEDPDYFETWVRPFLDHQIEYAGHMSGSALRACVAQARAVVVTPMWDEPFGLVAAEAMAAGVPVIAFDRGAMREVIGECGRIVEAGNVDALADAMRAAHELDGSACRKRIETLFSVERMILGYEAVYRQAISGAHGLPQRMPDRAYPIDACASSCSSTHALLA